MINGVIIGQRLNPIFSGGSSPPPTLLSRLVMLQVDMGLMFLLLALFLTAANATEHEVAEVEYSWDIGYEFRLEMKAVPSASSFESLAHYKYLYYKNIEIGRVDSVNISPSGRFAFYQDPPTGRLMVFDSRAENTIPLTDIFEGLAKKVSWKKDETIVEVEFFDSSELRRYSTIKTKQPKQEQSRHPSKKPVPPTNPNMIH